jgi:hypothetical protein
VRAYLEVGPKRTFAAALDWPGWARSGRTEAAALAALSDYADRYAKVVSRLRLGFPTVADATDLEVVERLDGDASTDFGVPGRSPSIDAEPLGPDEAKRQLAILGASWKAFERAVERAVDRELAKGPRGGGRSTEGIVEHVVGAEGAYLSRLGRRVTPEPGEPLADVAHGAVDEVRAAIRAGVAPSPRGGRRGTVRYYVRRAAWHILDHAWEIEDRTPR